MRTRRTRALVVVLLVAVALGACGGGKGSSADKPPAPRASTTTKADGCKGLQPGKTGIIRVFCGGTATAKVTIGTTKTILIGGTCEESGGFDTVNFGAVPGPDYTGTKPDYIGALFPEKGGAPQAVTVRSGGKGGLVTGATGDISADRQSVHIAGSSADGTVVVDISCY